jgi:co-chaperonin GroES (HSP10)
MSLMSHMIRSKPAEETVDKFNPFDPPNLEKMWSKEDLETRWSEYSKAFSTQRDVMEKEIGCFLPIKAHRVLVKAIILPNKTKGGVILSDVTKENNTIYNIGLVIGLGPESYKDEERFPLGPRCKIGDWISYTPFEKQKETFSGYLCYIIDDDRVNFPIPDITKSVREYKGYSLEEVQALMAQEQKGE